MHYRLQLGATASSTHLICMQDFQKPHEQKAAKLLFDPNSDIWEYLNYTAM